MTKLSAWIAERLAAGEPVVLITVAEARGSTPRESDAAMAVTAADQYATIGGGRLEWQAIASARRLLEEGGTGETLDLPLGPAVEQCCGGRVVLHLAPADAATVQELAAAERAENQTLPQVAVFGAGHVGRALVQALQPLPLALLWADSRTDIFPADTAAKTDAGDPLEAVARLAPGAAVFVMTYDHGLDFKIAEAALKRGDLAYVGLIGSRTKGRRFERWFVARGNDPRRLADLTCPIGDFGVDDKRPEVIAALAAAEVVTALAQFRREEAPRYGGGMA